MPNLNKIVLICILAALSTGFLHCAGETVDEVTENAIWNFQLPQDFERSFSGVAVAQCNVTEASLLKVLGLLLNAQQFVTSAVSGQRSASRGAYSRTSECGSLSLPLYRTRMMGMSALDDESYNCEALLAEMNGMIAKIAEYIQELSEIVILRPEWYQQHFQELVGEMLRLDQLVKDLPELQQQHLAEIRKAILDQERCFLEHINLKLAELEALKQRYQGKMVRLIANHIRLGGPNRAKSNFTQLNNETLLGPVISRAYGIGYFQEMSNFAAIMTPSQRTKICLKWYEIAKTNSHTTNRKITILRNLVVNLIAELLQVPETIINLRTTLDATLVEFLVSDTRLSQFTHTRQDLVELRNDTLLDQVIEKVYDLDLFDQMRGFALLASSSQKVVIFLKWYQMMEKKAHLNNRKIYILRRLVTDLVLSLGTSAPASIIQLKVKLDNSIVYYLVSSIQLSDFSSTQADLAELGSDTLLQQVIELAYDINLFEQKRNFSVYANPHQKTIIVLKWYEMMESKANTNNRKLIILRKVVIDHAISLGNQVPTSVTNLRTKLDNLLVNIIVTDIKLSQLNNSAEDINELGSDTLIAKVVENVYNIDLFNQMSSFTKLVSSTQRTLILLKWFDMIESKAHTKNREIIILRRVVMYHEAALGNQVPSPVVNLRTKLDNLLVDIIVTDIKKSNFTSSGADTNELGSDILLQKVVESVYDINIFNQISSFVKVVSPSQKSVAIFKWYQMIESKAHTKHRNIIILRKLVLDIIPSLGSPTSSSIINVRTKLDNTMVEYLVNNIKLSQFTNTKSDLVELRNDTLLQQVIQTAYDINLFNQMSSFAVFASSSQQIVIVVKWYEIIESKAHTKDRKIIILRKLVLDIIPSIGTPTPSLIINVRAKLDNTMVEFLVNNIKLSQFTYTKSDLAELRNDTLLQDVIQIAYDINLFNQMSSFSVLASSSQQSVIVVKWYQIIESKAHTKHRNIIILRKLVLDIIPSLGTPTPSSIINLRAKLDNTMVEFLVNNIKFSQFTNTQADLIQLRNDTLLQQVIQSAYDINLFDQKSTFAGLATSEQKTVIVLKWYEMVETKSHTKDRKQIVLRRVVRNHTASLGSGAPTSLINLRAILDNWLIGVIVADIRQSQFTNTAADVTELGSDKHIEQIVENIYHINNFELMTRFAFVVSSESRTVILVKWYDMMVVTSHLDENNIIVLRKLVRDQVKELGNSAPSSLTSARNKVDSNTATVLGAWGVQIRANGYSAIINFGSPSTDAFIGIYFTDIVHDLVTAAYSNTRSNLATLVKFVFALRWKIHRATGLEKLSQLLSSDQDKMFMALKVKHALESMTGPDPLTPAQTLLINLRNTFKQQIINVIFRSSCVLYNTHHGNYLYVDDDADRFEVNHKRALCYAPGSAVNQSPFKFVPVEYNDYVQFYVQNNYHASAKLHAYKDDRDSRYFVSASTSTTDQWRIELNGSDQILLYNLKKPSYLYASSIMYKTNKRYVYLWLPGTRTNESYWRLSCF